MFLETVVTGRVLALCLGHASRAVCFIGKENQYCTRDLIGKALRSLRAPFDVVAESNQPEVLSEMVLIGMGWTVLPRIQAARPPASLTPVQQTPLLKRTLVAAPRHPGLANPAAIELTEELQRPATAMS